MIVSNIRRTYNYVIIKIFFVHFFKDLKCSIPFRMNNIYIHFVKLKIKI